MASREASDNDSDYDSDASSVLSDVKPATKTAKKNAAYKEKSAAQDDESVGSEDLSDMESDLESENDDDDNENEDESDNENEDDDASVGPTAAAVSRNLPSRFENLFKDEDELEDDEDDEDYLQKFDENTRKNIIKDYYPELIQQNYDEIDVLSKTVRDQEGNIIDPLHTTLPILSKYEKTRIIGERARQLNAGATPLVDVEDNIIDGYLIALRELEEKKIPFIIKRPLPSGSVEYWRITDLEVI